MTSRDTRQIINGQAWHEYPVNYIHDGRTYSSPIFALDEEHAKQMLADMKANGQIGPRIQGVIDA